MSNLLIISFGIIGVTLVLAPFIGLFFDLKKSRKYQLFVSFAGVIILGLATISLLPSIEVATIIAFCLVPLLFIYTLLAKKLSKKTHQKINSLNEIDI